MLNLAMPEAPVAHHSRTQQRREKWHQQRQFKVGTVEAAC